MNILEVLIAKQKELRLTERAFAERLGIHFATWNAIKRGKFPINDAVLGGAMVAFPDLAVDIANWKVNQLRERGRDQIGVAL